MANRSSQKDLLDKLSELIAHNKGAPVLLGIGLALVSLVLASLPALTNAGGFVGWFARNHVLLYLGVIIGFLGILAGDAL